MTNFAHSRSWLAGALSRHSLLVRLAVPLAALLSVLLFAAAPAGAVVTTVGETTVGLQPRTEVLTEGEPSSFGNPEGNAVVHGASIYVDYWDPNDYMRPEWLVQMDTFFQQLGSDSGLLTNILANLAEYRDRTNTGAEYDDVFKGTYSDTERYPAGECTDPKPLTRGAQVCLTDAQIRTHLKKWIALHALPTGMNSIFYVILPPGATVCLDKGSTHCSDYHVTPEEETAHKLTSYEDSFCSYHAAINPDAAPEGDGNTVLYATLPWSAGTLGDAIFRPNSGAYAEAYDCQDGGWNPEKHREVREHEKEVTKQEETEYAEATKEKQKEILERRQEEGPHAEAPGAEGGGEISGWALAIPMDNQIAEEQANIATDPLLNAWHDDTGHEVTDLCRDVFDSTVADAGFSSGEISGSVTVNPETLMGTLGNSVIGINDLENPAKPYYINNVYNSSGDDCVGGASLSARFTSPNPVKNDEAVSFDGMESNVSLLQTDGYTSSGAPYPTYATFTWNFGDGTSESGYAPGAAVCEAPWISPCAGSVFHTYTYGGTYHVTLTITDTGGDVGRISHEVTVDGPPPPTPAAPGSGGTAGSSSAGGSAGAGKASGNASTALAPSPAVSASISSRSLRDVVRKGLVLRYSVNEQVAGHAEVLVTKALARKLKLSGPTATGLPAGTPAEIVIGKAVLVTTKAGKGTLTIVLAPSVAAHLHKAHSAGLIVRLVVRNTASKAGATASVLSSATLD